MLAEKENFLDDV